MGTNSCISTTINKYTSKLCLNFKLIKATSGVAVQPGKNMARYFWRQTTIVTPCGAPIISEGQNELGNHSYCQKKKNWNVFNSFVFLWRNNWLKCSRLALNKNNLKEQSISTMLCLYVNTYMYAHRCSAKFVFWWWIEFYQSLSTK